MMEETKVRGLKEKRETWEKGRKKESKEGYKDKRNRNVWGAKETEG